MKKLTTGERIAAAREAVGWTPAKLAELLRVSVSTVTRWEAGRTTPVGRSVTDLEGLLPALKGAFDERMAG